MARHFGGVNSSSDMDQFGFTKPDDFDDHKYDEFLSSYLPVLARRSKRWENVGHSIVDTNYRENLWKKHKFKRFVRKGIPSSHRAKVWLTASGANERQTNSAGEYRSLATFQPTADVIDQINLDLSRTFPDNKYFANMNSTAIEQLKTVLSRFAMRNPTVGYCQGLNYLCGMLLLILKDGESTFWLMETAIEWLPGYYDTTMKGIKIDSKVIEEVVKQKAPEVINRFNHFGFELAMVSTKWLVCWYLETLPIETVLRIWDVFFCEGPKILLKVAVALILANRQRLANCQSFIDLVETFGQITGGPEVLDCHKFMKEVFKSTEFLKTAQIVQLKHKFEKEITG